MINVKGEIAFNRWTFLSDGIDQMETSLEYM